METISSIRYFDFRKEEGGCPHCHHRDDDLRRDAESFHDKVSVGEKMEAECVSCKAKFTIKKRKSAFSELKSSSSEKAAVPGW